MYTFVVIVKMRCAFYEREIIFVKVDVTSSPQMLYYAVHVPHAVEKQDAMCRGVTGGARVVAGVRVFSYAGRLLTLPAASLVQGPKPRMTCCHNHYAVMLFRRQKEVQKPYLGRYEES